MTRNSRRILPIYLGTARWSLLAAIALLSVGMLGVYSYYMIRCSVRETARAGNRVAARMAAEVLTREFENSVSVAATFGYLPTLVNLIESHDEEGVRQRLRAAVESFPRIDRVSVLDSQGILWSDYPKAPETLGKSYAFRDYYLGMAREWKPYVSEVFRRTADPRPLVVAVSAPVRNNQQQVLGGVVCHYRLESLTEWLKQCALGPKGYVFVIDHSGNVAAHPKLDMQADLHHEYSAMAPVQAALQGTESTLEYQDPVTQSTMIATFLPVSVTGNDWVVVAQQPIEEAYAPIHRSGLQMGMITAILALAAGAAIIAMSRKQHQLQLAMTAAEVAQRHAEAASRAKSTFLANMSHEIRTPLNAVIGMTELVLKSQLAAQQREFLHTVRDSGEALLSVINDILDFSKIEAGKLSLDCSTFDLRESLGDTMKSFAIRAHQQGLELACFIHPEVPHMVVGDYGRLRQIVVHLIGNALKFTETGEVSLEVTREAHSEKDVVLHFVVVDTGIGIPLEKQSTIFEMFEQADPSTTRRHGGTGLGLAIATRLISLMGGHIWVESEVGCGSRFHFTVRLDLAANEPTEPLPPESASIHGMRVLVVDDNATNRRILDEVLRSWRVVPTTAPSAAEAIRLLLEAHQGGAPYRLVLTDAHMPRMDGFMLAEQIKKDSAMASTVVMMLTSGDRPEDMQRCEELGISAYLLKPIKQSELLEAIELALGISVAKVELLASAVQPRHARNMHILLAEDSLVNQKLAVALLEGQGHKVTVVNNGREAMAALQTGKFDMVLMDVQMPEMDGLEATEKIRTQEQLMGTHIPIIAMTAHALKGDRERCLAAGMDGYIAKPIHVAELFDVIDGLLGAPAERAKQPVPEMAEGGIINWQEALQAVRGNPQLLKTIVQAVLEEIPRLMAAICQAIAGSDAVALRLAAHTLKGSLRYFGKTEAFDEAFRLERMGQDKDLAEARAAFATLELAITQTTHCLQDYLQERRTPDV